MGVQETSLAAYEEVQPKLGQMQLKVYNALVKLREATNNMLAEETGLPINCITPRIYELRYQKRLVGVSRQGKCFISGKMAIFWKPINKNKLEEQKIMSFI